MSSLSAVTSGILAVGDTVFDSTYEVAAFLGGGNSGEVYRLSHPKHGENRVLKVFIPFYELRQAQIGEDEHGTRTNQIIANAKNQPYQRREYHFLSRLDHPFIVKVHDFGLETLTAAQAGRLRSVVGERSTGQITLPFIIAAYVKGVALDRSFASLGREGVLRVVRSVAEALDYLHVEHTFLHLDIKSTNVWVRPDGYPVLLDFALSQDLSDAAIATEDMVKGGIDWDLTPFRTGTSSVANFIQQAQTGGVLRAEFKAAAFPGIDLFQFGLMLRRSKRAICTVLTPAEQRYLRLLVNELTDWNSVRQLGPGSLHGLVRRIDATQFFLAIRPGSMSGGKEMPLSSGRKVFVPPKLVPIVDHPELTRLNRLNQLSLLPARFSGATHSRYEHALDVLRLSQSAARRLLDDPMCRRIFDESDVEALVTAALLHDINHLPLTHLYQESGLDVLRGRDLFREALDQSHSGQASLAEVVSRQLGQSSDRIHRLIEGRWQEQTNPADQVISSLINSGVDLDKLSYLRLDSERSGLGFAAGVDVGGLLSSMAVVDWVKWEDKGTFVARGSHIAFPEAAMPLIETLAMARSRAFESLYWCDDNRAMMAQFLACTRSISQADDGSTSLAELMLEVRAETDFAVLRRLDELAELVVGRSWHLSRLFDTIGGARPTLVYSAAEPYARIRVLAPGARLEFEDRLCGELKALLPSVTTGTEKLMVDVPARTLDLGGEILVFDRDGKVSRGLDVSDVLKTQAQKLGRLSSQLRMFVSPDVYAEWLTAGEKLGVEELERQVGQNLEVALGRSSLR